MSNLMFSRGGKPVNFAVLMSIVFFCLILVSSNLPSVLTPYSTSLEGKVLSEADWQLYGNEILEHGINNQDITNVEGKNRALLNGVPHSSKENTLSGIVDWQLYGHEKLKHKINSHDITNVKGGKHVLLHNASHSFKEDLLSGIPLECPFGEDDSEIMLIPKTYERFLISLKKYATDHAAMRKSYPRRTLVWQCSVHQVCGGLGDRLMGITYSLLLAIFSRRNLVIVWGDKSEGSFLYPHMINWKDETVDIDEPYFFRFFGTLIESKLTTDASKEELEYYMKVIGDSEINNVVLSTNLQSSSLLDQERNGNNPDWLVDGLQQHGLSHLSPVELDEVMGVVIRYLFKLDDDLLMQMFAAMQVLGLGPSPYVALHVRTGFADMPYEEQLNHPKLVKNESNWIMALHCAVKMADNLSGNNLTVFLATDSTLVKEIASSRYGTRVRTLNNHLIHVDKMVKTPHPLSAEEKEGQVVVWVEFLLLAQGKMSVRGESGFPWAAGLLCGLWTGSKNVINMDSCS